MPKSQKFTITIVETKELTDEDAKDLIKFFSDSTVKPLTIEDMRNAVKILSSKSMVFPDPIQSAAESKGMTKLDLMDAIANGTFKG